MPSELISIAAARQIVLGRVARLEPETVAVDDALGRVLAEPVSAAADVPPFASSAMDGYAIRAGASGRRLTVVGESRAGRPAIRAVGEGEAIRISTGAAVPAGATAVIRQEDVDAPEDGTIVVRAEVGPGANVRDAGEDMRAGAPVLGAGMRLDSVALGAAVAAGAGALRVIRQPVVWVLCTGDELRAPGEPLGPGEIHNSNAPMLTSLARRHGARATPARRLPDDRQATEQGLAEALRSADVVIVSGGVSVGPHDHVKPALAGLGVEEHFWRVALQPGKPTWFGTREGTLVFGLPGNPVSAVVTFTLFVAPALAVLLGADHDRPTVPQRASLGVPVPRNPQREQAIRVRLTETGRELVATPTGAQDSHMITSLLGADALAMIPAGQGEMPAGAPVSLEPLVL